MNKAWITNAVISKGFDGAPALNFSENGEVVKFRIGYKVYDSREENKTRWINITVRAFGSLVERIKKMKLKEGSYINILGSLDEDVWEDAQTHESKRDKVIILSDIEYASGGASSKSEKAEKEAEQDVSGAAASNNGKPASNNFGGYEAAEGGSSF